MYRKRTDSYSE